jgi:hypothetical protein
MSRTALLILGSLAIAAACGSGGEDASARPGRLVLIDSVTFEESDSVYLGAPLHVTAGSDGSLFVSDGLDSHVLQFSRAGRLVRRFGRKGSGPGELSDPLPTAIIGDSILAVAEWGNRRTSLFTISSGAFVRSIAHEGAPFWMEARHDTLWISGVNVPRKTLLASWRVTEDSLRYFGPVPPSYRAAPSLMAEHGYATLARSGDTIFVGLTGSQEIHLARPDGTPIGTVDIPAVRRRGVPADIVERFRRTPVTLTNAEIASMGSSLVALHRLPSGEVGAVHLDVTLTEKLLTAEGFVSILSGDRTRACPDTPIPLARDGRPAVAFRGDTLVVVEQRVVSATRAVTLARRYRVDTSQCAWRPVAGSRPGVPS